MSNNQNKYKAVFVRNPKAIELLKKRSQAENRNSLANAAETTIIEALQSKYGSFRDRIITKSAQAEQEKSTEGANP